MYIVTNGLVQKLENAFWLTQPLKYNKRGFFLKDLRLQRTPFRTHGKVMVLHNQIDRYADLSRSVWTLGWA
jgi:hypothetical protein